MDAGLNRSKAVYQQGKLAFESGRYRQAIEYLEEALKQSYRGSRLDGEIQLWLALAYHALGQQTEALQRCRQLEGHPDWEARQQGARLRYILEAPQLETRADWLVEIPDLAAVEVAETQLQWARGTQSTARSTPAPKPVIVPMRADPDSDHQQDNQFIWVALGAILLGLGSLWYLS